MAKNYVLIPYHELGRATERLKLETNLTGIQFEYKQSWPSKISRTQYEDVLHSEPGEIFDWSDSYPSTASSLEQIKQQSDRLTNKYYDIIRRGRRSRLKSRIDNVRIHAKDTLIIDDRLIESLQIHCDTNEWLDFGAQLYLGDVSIFEQLIRSMTNLKSLHYWPSPRLFNYDDSRCSDYKISEIKKWRQNSSNDINQVFKVICLNFPPSLSDLSLNAMVVDENHWKYFEHLPSSLTKLDIFLPSFAFSNQYIDILIRTITRIADLKQLDITFEAAPADIVNGFEIRSNMKKLFRQVAIKNKKLRVLDIQTEVISLDVSVVHEIVKIDSLVELHLLGSCLNREAQNLIVNECLRNLRIIQLPNNRDFPIFRETITRFLEIAKTRPSELFQFNCQPLDYDNRTLIEFDFGKNSPLICVPRNVLYSFDGCPLYVPSPIIPRKKCRYG